MTWLSDICITYLEEGEKPSFYSPTQPIHGGGDLFSLKGVRILSPKDEEDGFSITKERAVVHSMSFQSAISKKNILNPEVLNECIHEFTIQMSTCHYLNLGFSYLNYWE